MEIDADRGEGGANSSNNLHGSGRVNSTEGTQFHEFIWRVLVEIHNMFDFCGIVKSTDLNQMDAILRCFMTRFG